MTDLNASIRIPVPVVTLISTAPGISVALKTNMPAVTAKLITPSSVTSAYAPVATTIAEPNAPIVSAILSMISTGPQGLTGPQGIQGQPGNPGGHSIQFAQATPSALWVINHGFGTYPSVTVIDDNGEASDGDVVYTDLNNLTISFSKPQTGIAYIV